MLYVLYVAVVIIGRIIRKRVLEKPPTTPKPGMGLLKIGRTEVERVYHCNKFQKIQPRNEYSPIQSQIFTVSRQVKVL